RPVRLPSRRDRRDPPGLERVRRGGVRRPHHGRAEATHQAALPDRSGVPGGRRSAHGYGCRSRLQRGRRRDVRGAVMGGGRERASALAYLQHELARAEVHALRCAGGIARRADHRS
ncbi:hypothetical protein KXW51_007667, partial [Aspergillus fumigatus]